jgi:rRNA maturation RNase YbeY
VGEAESEISIEFVGNTRMRRLNRDFRQKDRTTDVLAFACREAGGPASPMLGDVVVSVPTAMGQAVALEHSLNEELVRLLIHGLLHLVGYDHELGEKEARRMRGKEEKLLAALKPLPRLVKL